MITGTDLYHVLTAVVPLYVAMILAYGSVRWWKIFSPEQCSGINRFVALFGVPLLSFHFISTNNPYDMNYRFIAADTLQKVMVLSVLAVWSRTTWGCLDWSITLFSISTLPNTLVMGIPLLKAMYGDDSGSLMVQIVVLQCIIWYTLMLFLFEYRAARILIAHQFPDHHTARSIVSFRVDSDILSLVDHPLQTEAEVGDDGKLHVTVTRKSSSRSCSSEVFSRRSHNNHLNSGFSLTPRPSNLSNAEIYSLQSSINATPRGSSSFNHTDFCSMVNGGGGSGNKQQNMMMMSPSRPSPRQSNFNFDEENNNNNGFAAYGNSVRVNSKELHMFMWSSTASPVVSERGGGIHVFRDGADLAQLPHHKPAESDYDDYGREGDEEFCFRNNRHGEGGPVLSKLGSTSTVELIINPKAKANANANAKAAVGGDVEESRSSSSMPPASVMTRLILIMVWRKLIRNPNTYSSVIGLTWSLISFKWNVEMPDIMGKSISILSDAGLGMAMFSLGLFMALEERMIGCGNGIATLSMGVRFVGGAAVMAVASLCVGLRGVLLKIAIVQAALPQGIVPFVFAKEYNLHPDILSTGVIFGMLIALPITLLYYILLGLL